MAKPIIDKYYEWYNVAKENNLLSNYTGEEIIKELGSFILDYPYKNKKYDPIPKAFVFCYFRLNSNGCFLQLKLINPNDNKTFHAQSYRRQTIELLEYMLKNSKELAAEVKKEFDDKAKKQEETKNLFN